MTNQPDPYLASLYRIKLRGRLKESWSEWFNGMTIEFEMVAGEKPVSTLTGFLADQSALHGILNKIRNLGLKLLSVEQINADSKNDKRK